MPRRKARTPARWPIRTTLAVTGDAANDTVCDHLRVNPVHWNARLVRSRERREDALRAQIRKRLSRLNAIRLAVKNGI
jgi:hypothetical protein